MEELNSVRRTFSRKFINAFGPRAYKVALGQVIAAHINEASCAPFWSDLLLRIEADAEATRAIGDRN